MRRVSRRAGSATKPILIRPVLDPFFPEMAEPPPPPCHPSFFIEQAFLEHVSCSPLS